MRRVLATIALALLTACAATAATSDPLTRACDDYATGVQLVAPLKAKLDPKIVRLVNAANAVSGPFCAFGPAAAHYTRALPDPRGRPVRLELSRREL
jgi:hypothetical protein